LRVGFPDVVVLGVEDVEAGPLLIPIEPARHPPQV
jgi:hypothetical protein